MTIAPWRGSVIPPFAAARSPASGPRTPKTVCSPNAKLVRIPDSYTFVSLDQPERLAELIADFVPSSV